MPLHLALFSWRPESVQLLLKHGADVNAQDGRHKTPLHLASSQDKKFLMPMAIRRAKFDEKADEKAAIVRVLIQHGADVNARDETQSTPLHLASSSGSPETVRVLIEHGAGVNTRDGSNNTPLRLALSSWWP
ncbi:ankyrin repeat protein, partial [Lactarius psammicola]